MDTEVIKAVVTYKGDIRTILNETGSRCPNRLVNGNTEQEVDVFRGAAASSVSLSEWLEMVDKPIQKECAKNGTVLGIRWCILEAK